VVVAKNNTVLVYTMIFLNTLDYHQVTYNCLFCHWVREPQRLRLTSVQVKQLFRK